MTHNSRCCLRHQQDFFLNSSVCVSVVLVTLHPVELLNVCLHCVAQQEITVAVVLRGNGHERGPGLDQRQQNSAHPPLTRWAQPGRKARSAAVFRGWIRQGLLQKGSPGRWCFHMVTLSGFSAQAEVYDLFSLPTETHCLCNLSEWEVSRRGEGFLSKAIAVKDSESHACLDL